MDKRKKPVQRSIHIHVRVTDMEHKLLTAIANNNSMTVSDLIRKKLELSTNA